MPAMTLPPTALAVSRERPTATVVDEVARGLVEDEEVASASLWLLGADCPDCRTRDGLHLAASVDRGAAGAARRRCAPLAPDSELGRLTGSLALDEQASGGAPGTLRALLAAEQDRLSGVTGVIAQPLVVHGQPLGLLCVFTREPIEDECLRCVRDYADLSAVSISNARAFDEVRSLQSTLAGQRDRLQLLLDVNAAVVRHLALPALLDAIATSLGRFVRHEYASLALREEGVDGLRLHALAGVGKDIGIHGSVSSFDGSPAGVAVRTGHPQVAHTEAELRAFENPRLDKVVEAGVKCMASAPLLVSGKPIGAVTAGSLRERAFGPAELELLLQVANLLAPAVSNALAYLEIERLKDKLAREKSYLEAELHHEFREIVGRDGGLAKVLEDVETVAPTDATVLIWGETGTGKELIARAIHDASGRKGTFVKLNCAAIPSGLLESELFGHEKGAFTGALASRVGRFELADGGTLFLDEVGDIPADLQPKLLRVLQEQEFERLGGNKTVKVDVRLVAATHRDLAEMVAARQFRSDLYYRLNVFPVTLPALRERRADIGLLARHFMERCARKLKKRIDAIPPATLATLEAYAWPGNVRELENVIERSVILTRGAELFVPPGALGGVGPTPAVAHAPVQAPGAPAGATLEDAERAHILGALRDTKWVLGGPAGAAARLGMNRTTLQSKMKRLGIERPAT